DMCNAKCHVRFTPESDNGRFGQKRTCSSGDGTKLDRVLFKVMSGQAPFPPSHLIGPFYDAGVFQRSGDQMAAEIIEHIPPDASVLEVGCGCGRLSRAFGEYLNPREDTRFRCVR